MDLEQKWGTSNGMLAWSCYIWREKNSLWISVQLLLECNATAAAHQEQWNGMVFQRVKPLFSLCLLYSVSIQKYSVCTVSSKHAKARELKHRYLLVYQRSLHRASGEATAFSEVGCRSFNSLLELLHTKKKLKHILQDLVKKILT